MEMWESLSQRRSQFLAETTSRSSESRSHFPVPFSEEHRHTFLPAVPWRFCSTFALAFQRANRSSPTDVGAGFQGCRLRLLSSLPKQLESPVLRFFFLILDNP
jgi:hypothetical protein